MSLRALPAVEKVLQTLGPLNLPRPVVVATVRRELAKLRSIKIMPPPAEILTRIRRALDNLNSSKIQSVINGTGILIHTNLGRSPIGPGPVETLQTIASNYNNLELDLSTGERGQRGAYLENNLALLCQSEAATVTNNCAAALVLILRHFTAGKKKEVIISRGELVQIGGGFRIPDILEASGAILREVGTTNKTALQDYARAINPDTALLLKVHRSNFFMSGFVESAATAEIAALAKKKRIPFVEDLGSGAMIATEKIASGCNEDAPLQHEPTPAEILKRGVDLVCFSGDKLFGGPQAGIIAGRARHVLALKREPFFRALRCDKLILAALQATVDLYLETPQPLVSIPVLQMLAIPLTDLRVRAEKIVAALQNLPVTASVGAGKSQLGGGTMPRSFIPSATVDLIPSTLPLAEFSARLRRGTLPVIGCVSGGRFKIDLRTVFPSQDPALIQALQSALQPGACPPEN